MEIKLNAKKVSERRRQKGLTQEDVARRAALSNACVVSIEGGKKEPLASTLAKIARVLQTKIEYFFTN